jgi:integrase
VPLTHGIMAWLRRISARITRTRWAKLQGLLGHRSIVSTAVYTRCLPPEAVRAELERMATLENTL